MLFPLLTKLLENISPADVGGMEETRMRACTLLSKVKDTSRWNQMEALTCHHAQEIRATREPVSLPVFHPAAVTIVVSELLR